MLCYQYKVKSEGEPKLPNTSHVDLSVLAAQQDSIELALAKLRGLNLNASAPVLVGTQLLDVSKQTHRRLAWDGYAELTLRIHCYSHSYKIKVTQHRGRSQVRCIAGVFDGVGMRTQKFFP